MEDDEENSTDIDEDNIEEEEENEEDNNNNNKEKEEESDEESDVEIPKKKFEESTREKELEEEILSIRTLTSSPSCSSLDEYFDSENNNFTFDEEEKNIEQLVDQIINHNIIDKLDEDSDEMELTLKEVPKIELKKEEDNNNNNNNIILNFSNNEKLSDSELQKLREGFLESFISNERILVNLCKLQLKNSYNIDIYLKNNYVQ